MSQRMADYLSTMTVYDILNTDFDKCECEDCRKTFDADPTLEPMVDDTAKKLKLAKQLLESVHGMYKNYESTAQVPSDLSMLDMGQP